MTANEIGTLGENLAAEFLTRQGYLVQARNVHSRYGEIDLICTTDEYIVFAEVKARGKNRLASPAAFVDQRKMKKIMKTALLYLAQHPTKLQPRFDIIEVVLGEGHSKIDHIKNAFGAEIMGNEWFA